MKRKKAEKIDTIRLIWEEIGKDEDGFEKNEEVSIDAFCKEKSVTRMEAYESMRAGVSVQAVFEIRQEDWEETRHIVNGKPEYARKAEHEKSSVRAKVEHVFAVIKGQFRYRKTRYRGLRKQTAKLNMLFALANLVLADRHCLPV